MASEHEHDWRTFTNVAGTKETRICRVCGLSDDAETLEQQLAETKEELEGARVILEQLYRLPGTHWHPTNLQISRETVDIDKLAALMLATMKYLKQYPRSYADGE